MGMGRLQLKKIGCVVEVVKSDFSLIKLIHFAKSSSFKIMFGKYSQKHTHKYLTLLICRVIFQYSMNFITHKIIILKLQLLKGQDLVHF